MIFFQREQTPAEKRLDGLQQRPKRRRLTELGKVDYSLLSDSKQSNTSSVELNTDEILSFITVAKLTKSVECTAISKTAGRQEGMLAIHGIIFRDRVTIFLRSYSNTRISKRGA